LTAVSWNVAGLAEDQVTPWLDQLTMLENWDFILMQEGFRRLGGVSTGEHVLFTPPVLCGGLRCPAIFVRNKWAEEASYAGGGSRWVAVDFQKKMLLISAHLPHKGRPMMELESTLLEIQMAIDLHPGYQVMMGVDANTKLCGMTDHVHVGSQVPRAVLSAAERDRAKAVHTFAAEKDLVVTNTWMDGDSEDQWCTRTNWNGEGSEQIDYFMTSRRVKVESIKVNKHEWFSSDHYALACKWSIEEDREPPRKSARSLRGWAPGPEWSAAVQDSVKDWSDWGTAATQLCETAALHGKKVQKEVDLELEALIARRKDRTVLLTVAQMRILSRSIWRRRRALKRMRYLGELEICAETGRAPRLMPHQKSMHYNWAKIAGDKKPSALITEHFSEIYALPAEEKQEVQAQRQHRIELGCEAQEGEMIPRSLLDKALLKLKKGKGSPDGLTAEILQELPDDCKSALAKDLSARCAVFKFPEEWCRSATTLAPKTVGATSLSGFRPIAGLSAIRKLLGYVWLLLLPALTFISVQTAFIPGSHADTGVYMLNRAAELAREWRLPLFVAQLDVKKAFDHVDHRAAFSAMELQGVSLQAVALIASIWASSVVSVSLGKVTSDDIPMDRGLPQGAPESALIFTMIMDMIIRALEPEWRRKGYGFCVDGLWLMAICYADDIVLAAASKEDLEGMISDIIKALSEIGLGVGAEKTHWTCTPQLPGTALLVAGKEIAWEGALTFVGSVVDLTGNAGPAILYRMAQANKAYAKWKDVLRCAWIPKAKRLKLLPKTVWSSLLWGSSTWTTTKLQRTWMNSWSARLVSRVARTSRSSVMDDAQWWRYMHREGHRLIARDGSSVAERAQQRVLRWAGHVARLPPDAPAASALRCRSLQWWRWRQADHRLSKDKWTGPHPQRFKVHRWEEQVAALHGEGLAEHASDNTGWMMRAQHREWWHQATCLKVPNF
jgi:hypothetical protein